MPPTYNKEATAALATTLNNAFVCIGMLWLKVIKILAKLAKAFQKLNATEQNGAPGNDIMTSGVFDCVVG
jgi:hypothetical protein